MIGRAMVLVIGILSMSCMASPDDWSAYIRRVEQADHKTIQALPDTIDRIGDTLDDTHSEELTIAISEALIKDPVSVINATKSLDNSTDRLKQRFGTSFICSIPGMNRWTQAQIEAWFSKAEPVLRMAGPLAADCLDTMRDTLDELRQEIAKSPVK